MQWGIEQANGNRQTVHSAEYLEKILPLDGQPVGRGVLTAAGLELMATPHAAQLGADIWGLVDGATVDPVHIHRNPDATMAVLAQKVAIGHRRRDRPVSAVAHRFARLRNPSLPLLESVQTLDERCEFLNTQSSG